MDKYSVIDYQRFRSEYKTIQVNNNENFQTTTEKVTTVTKESEEQSNNVIAQLTKETEEIKEITNGILKKNLQNNMDNLAIINGKAQDLEKDVS